MARKVYFVFLIPIFMAILSTRPIHAQTTGQIVGTVADSQSNVIANADVVVTNEGTGIQRKTKTDGSGAYTISLLQPGSYRIDVTAPGFRPLGRTGISLQVAQTGTVNVTLQVGTSVETVNVSEELPLLDLSTAAIGGVVEPEQMENLPMLGRNSNSLMVLEPGVIATRATTSAPVLESHYQFFSINGSRPNQSQFLLDGGNDTNLAFNGPEYTPLVEEVQEYRTQTSNFSAQYGNSAGGVINIATKAGTNDFHGSLFEYLRNDIFSANDYFSNLAGKARPKLRYNQFGGSVGGPIIRNRAFFFFSYEGLRQITPNVVTTSVPTALQRVGDFSQTDTSTGQLTVIYDPLTTVPNPSNPGQYVRSPFAGNKIPASRLDPVALAIQNYYPAPNQAGNPGTGLNNYFFSGGNIQHVNNYSGRGDYQLSDSTQINGRYSLENLSPWVVPATFGAGNIASPGYSTKPQHHPYVVGRVIHTFSPTLIGEFHTSWARWFYQSFGLSNGFDPTKLGFPGYLAANSQTLGFPAISPGEMSSLGNYYNEYDVSDRYEFAGNLTKTWSKHNLHFGALYGLGKYTTKLSDTATGTYTSNLQFTQGPNPLVGAVGSGFGYASFLLGTLSSATQNPNNISGSYDEPYWGVYAEDNIKVTPNLTVNLGLRWDVESPRTEAQNRLSNFDFTDTATLANGAKIVGGLEFPGVNRVPKGDWQSNDTNFAPRMGAAYSLGKDTVIRSGYGIFYGNSWGNGRNNGAMPQAGFFCSTQANVSLNNGLTPYATLSNPFPQGFCQATGSSAGLQTNLGQTLQFINRTYKTPYLQSWNLDVQRALPGKMVFQIAYSGSHGVHLPAVREYDQLNPSYLSLGAQLNSQVPNPYAGVITSGQLSAPTITLGQSLRPFPQFTDVSSRSETFGVSSYNAMFVSFEKHTSNGFTLSASYTWAKLIDDIPATPNYGGFPGSSFYDSNLQNFYDSKSEKALASYDIPQTLVISYIYEFPFGPGKRFLNGGGVLGRVVGGWQINGLTTFQSGSPVEITGGTSSGTFDGTQRPNWTGKNPKLSGSVNKRLNGYFDTSQFSYNAPFTFGNTPRSMPDLFQPGIDDWSMSLFKETSITEKTHIQFRAEAFNTFNRVQFGAPNANLGPGFGVISSQQNGPRTLQLGLRFSF
jgi:Carboxypeptidase regulatory-like domain